MEAGLIEIAVGHKFVTFYNTTRLWEIRIFTDHGIKHIGTHKRSSIGYKLV